MTFTVTKMVVKITNIFDHFIYSREMSVKATTRLVTLTNKVFHYIPGSETEVSDVHQLQVVFTVHA